MTYIIGADPGVSGCIVVLAAETYGYVDHLHMPTMKVGSKNRVNAAALAAWLREWDGATIAYLEDVAARPGQGVSSMFSFGRSAGILEGCMAGVMVPVTYVTPTSWKKRAGLVGKDKDAARSRAIQLYPSLRDLDLKGKGQALADAILIARFGGGLE